MSSTQHRQDCHRKWRQHWPRQRTRQELPHAKGRCSIADAFRSRDGSTAFPKTSRGTWWCWSHRGFECCSSSTTGRSSLGTSTATCRNSSSLSMRGRPHRRLSWTRSTTPRPRATTSRMSLSGRGTTSVPRRRYSAKIGLLQISLQWARRSKLKVVCWPSDNASFTKTPEAISLSFTANQLSTKRRVLSSFIPNPNTCFATMRKSYAGRMQIYPSIPSTPRQTESP